MQIAPSESAAAALAKTVYNILVTPQRRAENGRRVASVPCAIKLLKAPKARRASTTSTGSNGWSRRRDQT